MLNELEGQIRLFNMGAAEAIGKAQVVEPADRKNWGSTYLRRLIAQTSEPEAELISLDLLQLDAPPRMIKIDVEGMEVDVLRGAYQLLETHQPLLYVECADATALSKVLSELAPLGYRPVAQFNSTPTVFFVPDGHALAHSSHPIAFSRLAEARNFGRTFATLHDIERASNDSRRVGETISRQQDALIGALGEVIEAQRVQSSHLETLTNLVAQLDERLLKQDNREELLKVIETRFLELSEHMSTFYKTSSPRLHRMDEMLQSVLQESRKIPDAFAESIRGRDSLVRSQERLARLIDEQSKRLTGVESRLFALSRGSVSIQSKTPAKKTEEPLPVPLPPWRRKLRKLRRNPALFVRDMKMPWS